MATIWQIFKGFLLLTVLLASIINAEPLKFKSFHEPLNVRQHVSEPKQEWSYVDVREGAHMFYWLYYTTATTGFQDKPLILWLQGGPGGSGTGFGNFEEIGPVDVDMNPRNTTWLQAASLLFVDNPVGSGYSYVDDDKYFTTNVAQIASDMIGVLKVFFMQKSPQFQQVPFYIFSESYGGKMTAAISQALYQNIQAGNITCLFKGLAMGDSWISPIDSTKTWAPYLYTNSLIDEKGLVAINDSVTKIQNAMGAGKWKEATDLWGSTQTVVDINTDGVNFYNILEWGKEEKSMLFSGNTLADRMLGRLHKTSLDELMNGKIRDKFGIIPKNVKWGAQSNKVFSTQSEDFMKPVINIVDDLIQNTPLKVIVYSGQLDLIVDTVGTEIWVNTLSIGEKYRAAKRSSVIDPTTNYPGGYVKTVDNFSFYWILDAGHMVPSDNGETALKMIRMITDQE